MKSESLDRLFSPESVAIIGASTHFGTVGNDIAKNLIHGGYAGKVFPVNPKTDELYGATCYPDISAVPETPDMAIVAVPAAVVPDVLRQSAAKGVRAAVVISAEFRETGPGGAVLEQEIADIASEHDMAILGPNCLGFLHPSLRLNASFAAKSPKAGPIGFLSQSGALMTAILDLSEGKVGFSNFVGTGNKTVLDERSLIGYLADDKETRVISFYAEGLGNAPEIIRLGRDIMKRPEPKPIVALKSGRTESGIRASGSHTGSLAGTDAAYDALFRQARILRAESMRQFLDTVSALAENPVPNGPNTVIVTNAGGPGVITADAATKAGLSVRALSEETASALRQLLPPAASVGNPVDLLGDAKADRYRSVLGPIVEAEETDAAIVILTPQSMTEAEETAEAIIRAKKDSGKPVFAVFAGGSSVESAVSLLRGSGVSVFTYPEDAADVLGLLVRISEWRKKTVSPLRSFKGLDRERVRSIIDGARAEGRKDLTGQEAESVLAAYGFPLLESRLASDPESAGKAAREIGGNVALKIASPDITHKTDAGGVMLDIPAEDVAGKYSELVERVRANRPDAKIDGVTVMEMGTPGGKELILGVKREEGLGTLVLVGMGGIYAETLKDVSFRFAPLAPEDVDEMLSELRILPLLRGVRGEEGVDMTPITESLERLSRLVEDFPEIAELDINPLSVHPDGKRSRVLDARMTIG